MLQYNIDPRKQPPNKIHAWPGCAKMSNVLDAPRMLMRQYNDNGEDRAAITHSMGAWCKLCNPGGLTVPPMSVDTSEPPAWVTSSQQNP